MTGITRQPAHAQSEHYDVIIVGGGIYGAMLLLEAAGRGQRALLLEKQDFGSGTSYNSLRIIHGGLRYLQSLDLARLFESVAERRWFLQAFPELVKPLPCLMPLYDRGIQRPLVLRTALWMNDLLSANRNKGATEAQTLPDGRILDPAETQQVFPGAELDGLSGAALWYDAHMPDSQRVVIETLRWACALGAQAFNYVEVNRLVKTSEKVAGVQATDKETGQSFEFRADIVINATGPGTRAFAAGSDQDIASLFRPSLAWNMLLNCPAPSTHALALTPNRPGGHTYFLHPWKGRLLAGTGHQPWTGPADKPAPNTAQLERFIADLNLILPRSRFNMDDIVRVYSGFLPVEKEGGIKLSDRALIHDHGRHGGPRGFYSVTGVKFTTARKEAERAMNCVMHGGRSPGTDRPDPEQRPLTNNSMSTLDYDWLPEGDDNTWKMDLGKLIKQESVLHLDDLVLRRTSIGDNPQRTSKLAAEIATLFNWDENRRDQEIHGLLNK